MTPVALVDEACPSHVSGWRTEFDESNVPHVLPPFGPKHELSLRCWCHPVVDNEYEEPAISHNVAQ